jgi:carboxylesterase type B
MTYDAINPVTGRQKTYANSAEFLKAVEAARPSTPREQPKKNMTFAEANAKLRKELGIDDRTQAEKQAAFEAEKIATAVAAGVQKALQGQQKADKVQLARTIKQTPPARTVAQSITPERIECLCQAAANIRARYGNFMPCTAPTNQAQAMTAGHAAEQQPRQIRRSVIQSAGHAQVLTAGEAEARLNGSGIKF